MHYKMAVGDIIKLSRIFVFLAHRNRWNFTFLVKKAWGAGGSAQNLSNPRGQPAQPVGSGKAPREKSAPEARSSG